ncbi:MAG: alpha/beta hydrolase [Verrucomicrobiia bacterium]
MLIRLTLIAAVVVVVFLSFGCASIERKLLFYPSHATDANGLQPWVKDNRLIGFSRMVESPKNVWLMIHGNGGQAADRSYAIHCFSNEDSVFILEYPGYGTRSGKPSRKSFNEAAEEAYFELRQLYPGVPVCVVGESIGSGGASYLASLDSPPEKVALVVPFDILSLVAKERFPSTIVKLVLRSNWDNVDSLSGYKGPIEIFGAKLDTIIPVSHAQTLAASVPHSKLTLLEGGHNDWSIGDRVNFRNP